MSILRRRKKIRGTRSVPLSFLTRPRLTAPLFLSLSDDDSQTNGSVLFALKEELAGTSPSFELADPKSQIRCSLPTSEATSSQLREQGCPAGLYDLRIVQHSRGLNLTKFIEPHAVKVVDRIPEEYTFCVITDLHLGDYRIRLHGLLKSNTLLVEKWFKSLSEHKPEFVLFCGDSSSLIFLYPSAYSRIREMIARFADYPVFFVPGNHDGYVMRMGKWIWRDGWNYWSRFLGPRHYSFNFGRDHFVGVNSYDWSSSKRNLLSKKDVFLLRFNQGAAVSQEQLSWLRQDLEEARAREDRIFVFVHHNPLRPYFLRPNGQRLSGGWDGPHRLDVLALFKEFGVNTVFCGHQHYNLEETWEGIRFVTTVSAASLHERNHPWGFRKVQVRNGEIVSMQSVTA